MSILLSLLLSGCCRNEVAPILDTPQVRSTDENSVWTVPLEDIVLDSSLELGLGVGGWCEGRPIEILIS